MASSLAKQKKLSCESTLRHNFQLYVFANSLIIRGVAQCPSLAVQSQSLAYAPFVTLALSIPASSHRAVLLFHSLPHASNCYLVVCSISGCRCDSLAFAVSLCVAKKFILNLTMLQEHLIFIMLTVNPRIYACNNAICVAHVPPKGTAFCTGHSPSVHVSHWTCYHRWLYMHRSIDSVWDGRVRLSRLHIFALRSRSVSAYLFVSVGDGRVRLSGAVFVLLSFSFFLFFLFCFYSVLVSLGVFVWLCIPCFKP